MGIDDEVTDGDRTCPACQAPTPAGSRFCPSCGVRLDEDETAIAYTTPERRLFGVVPPVAAFVLACIFVGGALVGFATGSWILGLSLGVLAAVMLVVFDEAARRAPETALTRRVLGIEDRLRDRARLTRESTRAWTGAGTAVVRLRREVRGLRQKRRGLQLELGDAAYLEDEVTVAALKARIRELDGRIDAAEQARTSTLERARGRVAEERLAVQPTHVIPPDEPGAGGPGTAADADSD